MLKIGEENEDRAGIRVLEQQKFQGVSGLAEYLPEFDAGVCSFGDDVFTYLDYFASVFYAVCGRFRKTFPGCVGLPVKPISQLF